MAVDRRWTPRAVVTRFMEVAREDGARTLWFKVWGELCYRRLGLFELPLGRPVPAAAPQVSLTVAPLAEDDGDDYEGVRPGARATEIVPRFAAGHRCYAARAGDGMVSTCWVARGRLWSSYLGCHIDLAPQEAITYETYTVPASRGLGIGPAMRTRVIEDLRNDGCDRLLATVDPDNRPGVRLVEKLGYRRIGTVGYFGVGALRRDFCRLEPGAAAPGGS